MGVFSVITAYDHQKRTLSNHSSNGIRLTTQGCHEETLSHSACLEVPRTSRKLPISVVCEFDQVGHL